MSHYSNKYGILAEICFDYYASYRKARNNLGFCTTTTTTTTITTATERFNPEAAFRWCKWCICIRAPRPRGSEGGPRAAKFCLRRWKTVKTLPPALKNGQNLAYQRWNTVKICPPAVKYSQNFASGGKKRSYYFEKCGRRGLPEKMHQGPPDSKAAPDSTTTIKWAKWTLT